MSEPRKFICQDCGTLVFSFGEPHANDQDICAECTWLRDIEDPVEREQVRKWLEERKP